jgi:hypothetical protein
MTVHFLARQWQVFRQKRVAFKQKHSCVRLPVILFLTFSEDTTGRILVVYTRTVWLEYTVVTEGLKLIKKITSIMTPVFVFVYYPDQQMHNINILTVFNIS